MTDNKILKKYMLDTIAELRDSKDVKVQNYVDKLIYMFADDITHQLVDLASIGDKIGYDKVKKMLLESLKMVEQLEHENKK